MSQTLLFVVLSLHLLVFSISVSAQSRWKLAVVDSNGQTTYVDENLTQQPNGNILGWQKGNLSASLAGSDDSYFIARYEWDCRSKASRQLQIFVYDRFGLLTEKIEGDKNWTDNPPGSIGDVVLNVVCRVFEEKNKPAQRSTSVSLFAEIIKKANLMSEADPDSTVIRKVGLGEKLILASEESLGVWYRVIDPKTNSEGWLNGNYFKIVIAKKQRGKNKSNGERNN